MFKKLLFLEIGLDLRRGGAFLANAAEQSFEIGRRERFGPEQGRKEQEQEGEKRISIKHFQVL